MSTRMRLLPLIVLLLLAASGLLVACQNEAAAQTGDAAAPTAGTITVVGQGEAFGPPDQAQIQVGVETFAATVDAAMNENEAKIEAILAALGEQDIPESDIQTTNYSLWAEQRYGDNGPEGIVGYRVTNQVNVKVGDIGQVGAVMAAVTEAGANSIYGVNFSVADPAALESAARAAAMADARARAQELAGLGEVGLGEVKTISEVIQSPQPYLLGMGGGAAMEAAAEPSISPGQLTFQVQLQVTYTIQ